MKPKNLEEFKTMFPEMENKEILKLAKMMKIKISLEDEMIHGTHWEDIQRGRAEAPTRMIVTPDVVVDGKKIVGVCIDPRVLLPTIAALLKFADTIKKPQ
jgi:hypothetical protein